MRASNCNHFGAKTSLESLHCLLFAVAILTSAVSLSAQEKTEQSSQDSIQPAIGDPADSSAIMGPDGVGTLADVEIEPYRLELLEIANDSVRLIPKQPFIKTRSREQEAVFRSALALDQPAMAIRFLKQIDNWRRGLGYADFAVYALENGETGIVSEYLQRAELVSEVAEDWRFDRIMTAIARARLLQGDEEGAEQLETDVQFPAEQGTLEIVRSRMATSADFEARMSAVRAAAAGADFDAMRKAFLSAIELFARLYDDEATRDQIQSTLLDLLDGFPMTIRIEVVVGLAEVAHLNQDTARALELSVLAEEFLKKGAGAPAETRLPIMGDVARIRHYGGDDASARDMLENASKLFTSEREMIIDMYRAKALLPSARAYFEMGDHTSAHAIYELAFDESRFNINNRPRATNLALICCSMAETGCRPTEAFLGRLVQARQELDAEW